MIKELWEQNKIMTLDARETFPPETITYYYLYGDPMQLSAAGQQQFAEFILQTQTTQKL
jgi:hypothetical protein